MNRLAQPARGESLCESCRRPWFGSVAYCPYCGRKPSFTAISQQPAEQMLAMPAQPAVEWDSPAPSQPDRTASTFLFKTVVAGVSALLLLWVAIELPATRANQKASPQLAVSTSGIAAPVPPRTETVAPPQPSRSPLCSAASEAAGLCKSP